MISRDLIKKVRDAMDGASADAEHEACAELLDAAERDDTTHNGWANYETWAVGMFLDGNYTGEGTYLSVLEITRSTLEEAREHAKKMDVPMVGTGFVADALKEYVSDRVGEETGDALGNGIASDLLGAALGSVDWRELAEHKIAEVSENA